MVFHRRWLTPALLAAALVLPAHGFVQDAPGRKTPSPR
jgi:hypothetical protein